MRNSKDAATFTVLFEDTSDVLGLIIAFPGIFLEQVFNNPLFDGLASILIGILLVGVAGVLARESQNLLPREGVDPETARQLKALTEADSFVQKALRIATIYLGPEEITLAQDVIFHNDLTTDEINKVIVRVHAAIMKFFPSVKHAFTQPVALGETSEKQ